MSQSMPQAFSAGGYSRGAPPDRSPEPQDSPTADRLLQRGRNVARIVRAQRFSYFLDVASCFGAMRSAMRQARESITIVGWDIDSRTRLVGSRGEPEDGYPAELGAFLEELRRANPQLRISILLWDYATIYALERQGMPRMSLGSMSANLVLDNCLPLGSSQHQKIVIIDDSIAFSGGLDVTVRRWDTADHRLRNRLRVDPNGTPYNPFHDVQAVVDGEAAEALAELVRLRWQCASGEPLPQARPHDIWPERLEPDFRDVAVGISRTIPEHEEMHEVREVERLFLDMIAAAERSLYIENQFLTSAAMAQAVAKRLKERPTLEVLFIAPMTHHSWLEAVAMRHGRIRFHAIVEESGCAERVRFAYPRVKGAAKSLDVMVHSKVMIVDDRLLRVGSANLNNRSMGADSECDLVVEASSEEERQAVRRARARLLAVHCGVTADEAEAALSGSLVEASRKLRGSRHSLVDIDDGRLDVADYPAFLDKVADPERPIDAKSFLAMLGGERGGDGHLHGALMLGIVATLLLSLGGFWALFADQADTAVQGLLRLDTGNWTTPLLVVGIFLAGAALMVPVTVMIVGAAAVLGLAWGLVYAALGALVSAAAFYGLGAWLGSDLVRRVMGGRLAKVRNAVRQRGVVAVAAIRIVPIAPFSFVNLAAGATAIGFWPFMLGTVLGMAPGFFVLSALGDQLSRLISEPRLTSVVILFALLLLWLATVLIAQRWVRRKADAA